MMAVFTSTQNGDWDDGATWGNTSPGVQGTDWPGAADDIQMGHTVTYDLDDDTTEYDDVQLNNSSILIMADTGDTAIRMGKLNTYYGEFRVGTSGARYTNKCTIIITDSAMTGAAGVGIMGMYGATKSYYQTTLNGAGTATDTTITTTDTTGWAVGDLIAIQPTGTGTEDYYEVETFRINNISGTTITLGLHSDETTSDALAFAHLDNAIVLNLTYNIVVRYVGVSSTANFGSYRNISSNVFNHVTFEDCVPSPDVSSTTPQGRNTHTYDYVGVFNTLSSGPGINISSGEFLDLQVSNFYAVSAYSGLDFRRIDRDTMTQTRKYTFTDCFFWGYTTAGIGASSSACVGGDQPTLLYCKDCHFAGFAGSGIVGAGLDSLKYFEGCYVYAIDDVMVSISNGNTSMLYDFVFKDCELGYNQLGATNGGSYSVSFSRYGSGTFINCKLNAGLFTSQINNGGFARFVDYNQTAGDDRFYTMGGYISPDSTVKYATTDSLKFISNQSNVEIAFPIKIYIDSTGTKTIGIRGKKSATAGWTTHPSFFVQRQSDDTFSSEVTFSDVDTNWNQKTTTFSATAGDVLLAWVKVPYNTSSDFNIDDITIS